MQERRGDGLVVHVEVQEDVGDFQGVGDVGFSALAVLAVVRLLGKGIGSAYQGTVQVGKVGPQTEHELFDGRGAGGRTGQDIFRRNRDRRRGRVQGKSTGGGFRPVLPYEQTILRYVG
jgi:hypothetical protein